MENNDNIYYGTALTAISAASGLGLEIVAVTAAALLGGVAGKNAGITDVAGSLINPTTNLVIAGLDSPRYRRGQEMLLAPILECQQILRDLSSTVHRERFEILEGERSEADATTDLIKGRGSDDFNRGSLTEHSRRFQALRRPGVLVYNPDPAHFTTVMNETLDGHALIVYPDGNLLDSGLQPRRPKAITTHLAAVADAVTGSDHSRTDPGRGFGATQTWHAGLLAACKLDELNSSVVSEDPNLSRLIRHCTVLDVPADHQIPVIDLQATRNGYYFYQEAVRDIFIARRAGGGIQFEPEASLAAPMNKYVVDLRGWLDTLPPHILPFFGTALSLPYKLLWTLRTLVARGESHEWCVPAAIHTTNWVLERQARLLCRAISKATQTGQEHARATMLAKLRARPCLFRDLLRQYRTQRKDVHEPILQELVGDGLVHLRDDGLLELTEKGLRLAA